MRATVNIGVGRKRFYRNVGDPWQAAYGSKVAKALKEYEGELRSIINGLARVTPDALRYGLEPISVEAQKLVPVDTGDLRSSHYLITKPTIGGVSANIGYAKGGNPAYAAIVHERLDLQHRPPTQAKFMQAAVERKQHLIVPRVTRYLKKYLAAVGAIDDTADFDISG